MSTSNQTANNYESQVLSAIGQKLYLSTTMADVNFVFESKDHRIDRIPAHKAHLMAASDVFEKMFNGSWKEKNEVKIVDVSVAGFTEFLQFFYLAHVNLTVDNVAEVMNLGNMYNVAGCLSVCEKFLKRNLSDDNVCEAYKLAILFNQESLKDACEIFIEINAKAVLKSDGFVSCDRKVLTKIVKLNWMTCSESELFEGCMAWVKATTKQNTLTKELVQSQLGELFYEIRFGLMTMDEFVALIPSYGKIFGADEYTDIIQLITDKDFQSNLFPGNKVKRRRNSILSFFLLNDPHHLIKKSKQ
ncbi:BTB/POZ domain-containing protein 2-like [Sitodiplosis mosellana]|uniref:BTB/POZ domain-containing protein 2-like n=1 Tax=Sitodiplosis mosellana TaxID=263140 RepID=UPI0024450FD4|nr:BTB/POZ domain-containing protein 2-like [Sitodiplosis mosellana]